MTLFKRQARLLVGDLDVTDLRFGFTVEKHRRKEPNTAKISVWNLSADNRKSLEERTDGVPVQLEAGYLDDVFLLWLGKLDVAMSEKDGPNWITNIYTDDGKDAVKHRGKVSYRAGTDVKRVLDDLSSQLGVGLGNLIEEIGNSKSLSEIGSAFSHGFSAKGGLLDSLFGVLEDSGIHASIQDGEIQAAKINRPVEPTAVLLRNNTGLVDTPSVDRKGRLEARALLNSGLRPGYAVEVDSLTAKGQWLIDSVTYVGDTAGQDWYAEIEGVPIA